MQRAFVLLRAFHLREGLDDRKVARVLVLVEHAELVDLVDLVGELGEELLAGHALEEELELEGEVDLVGHALLEERDEVGDRGRVGGGLVAGRGGGARAADELLQPVEIEVLFVDAGLELGL